MQVAQISAFAVGNLSIAQVVMGCLLRSTIGIFSVSHFDNADNQFLVFNRIQNAVNAATETVFLFSGKLAALWWAWIIR